MDAIIYLKSLYISNIRFDFGRQAYDSLLSWAPQPPVPYHLALRSGAYLEEAQPYSIEEFTPSGPHLLLVHALAFHNDRF